jgi:hypothetical protein
VATKNPYELASLAECASPDSLTSPGASFLERVADAADSIREEGGDEDNVSEAADSAVPVYTHERWQVFVDLAAYNEDVTELGATGDDLTGCAGVALYMIAERLLHALLAEDVDEDADEEEEAE